MPVNGAPCRSRDGWTMLCNTFTPNSTGTEVKATGLLAVPGTERRIEVHLLVEDLPSLPQFTGVREIDAWFRDMAEQNLNWNEITPETVSIDLRTVAQTVASDVPA